MFGAGRSLFGAAESEKGARLNYLGDCSLSFVSPPPRTPLTACEHLECFPSLRRADAAAAAASASTQRVKSEEKRQEGARVILPDVFNTLCPAVNDKCSQVSLLQNVPDVIYFSVSLKHLKPGLILCENQDGSKSNRCPHLLRDSKKGRRGEAGEA